MSYSIDMDTEKSAKTEKVSWFVEEYTELKTCITQINHTIPSEIMA